jgi:acyl carrier protein
MDSSASPHSYAAPVLTATRPFTSEDEAQLRDALKRCSPSTFEAACQFRQTGNVQHVPVIIFGVIEHYVESKLRPRLKEPADHLRLVEDLAIDSLTLMEIVMLAEDVLQITIDNDELPPLRTLGEVRVFMEAKISGAPFSAEARQLAS